MRAYTINWRYDDYQSRIIFFFFQAEDGIRDGRVTGVQTCALPISSSTIRFELPYETNGSGTPVKGARPITAKKLSTACARSEERRVGKECRYRWSPYHLKKKIRLGCKQFNSSNCIKTITLGFVMQS